MIIYAPYIENIIPAFLPTGVLKIPFSHNIGVERSTVTKMYLLIKDLKSSQVKLEISTDATNIDWDNGIVKFEISSDIYVFEINQYYKFQLAYSDEDLANVLKYSTVGIGKCIGQPKLFEIRNGNKNIALPLESSGVVSENPINYIGVYQTYYSNEPIYRYRFVVEDLNSHIIVEDTDWISPAQEENYFSFNSDLEERKIYRITFYITTVNGYEDSCSSLIKGMEELPDHCLGGDAELIVSQTVDGIEGGYVLISFGSNTVTTTGDFEILRMVEGTKKWEVLKTFKMLDSYTKDDYKWKDCTIENGVTYRYAIRQYIPLESAEASIRGIRSKSIESQPITPFLEYTYLSDEDRQLCIKFNPKVSSIKNVTLESKTDTIGGKYPFFFKNGTVNYKELPISGLISYFVNDNLFIKDFLANGKEASINLSNENIKMEYDFKLEVLNWLTNGKPKLFRSATEGNHIVRLMNINLTPEDKLGRMLHSFSATGYECAEFNLQELNRYHLNGVYSKELKTLQTTETKSLTYDSSAPEKNIVKGKLSNIVYTANAPFFTEGLKVDGNSIIITSNSLFVPTANEIELLNNSGQIIYTIETLNQPNPNDFINRLLDSITKTFQFDANTETVLAGRIEEILNVAKGSLKINNYFRLFCCPISTSKESSIKFGESNKIIITENKEFYNLNPEEEIVVDNLNVYVGINYTIKPIVLNQAKIEDTGVELQ